MDTQLYLLCLVGGLLGILFHIVIKLQAVKKRVEATGIKFSIKVYLSAEWLALVSSVITIFICIFVLDEITRIKPQVLDILKFFFVFIGYTGSSILQTILGKTDKAVNKLINDAPNITGKNDEPLNLDGIIGDRPKDR
jgi:hypothetical protein